MALRSCLAENQFLMSGQCAVMPAQIVDKIVKNSSRVTTLDDLVLLGVSCAVAQKVLEVLNRVAPVDSVGAILMQPLCDVCNAIDV